MGQNFVFGEYITRLSTSVETFVDWLSNGSPSWEAYCAFMSGRLIALDKQPGVRMIGVEETWRRLFSKIIIKVTIPEATMACQDDQLCAGLTAVIDGAIHGFQALWDKTLSTEEWGFLLVDAKSASTRLIYSECSGRSNTYGHPELVLSSTDIVTVNHSFCGTIIGRQVFYILEKE